jgi:hypothetical protein
MAGVAGFGEEADIGQSVLLDQIDFPLQCCRPVLSIEGCLKKYQTEQQEQGRGI